MPTNGTQTFYKAKHYKDKTELTSTQRKMNDGETRDQPFERIPIEQRQTPPRQIKVGNMSVAYKVHENGEFDLWKYADHTERRPIVLAIQKAMYKLKSYSVNRKEDEEEGKRLLKVESRRNDPVKDREDRKRIDEIIKNAFQNQVIKAEQTRYELKINEGVSVFANQSLENDFENMSDDLKFEYIRENVQNIENATEAYKEARLALQAEEPKFVCDCTDGCNKKCRCATLHNSLFETCTDSNRHYSCSSACGCQGKCNKSFPDGPQNGAEASIHKEFVKGGTLRSLQYFAPGESVTELKGQVLVESDVGSHRYAMSTYDPVEAKVLENWISKTIQNEKKDGTKHDGLTSEYDENLKKVGKLFHSIDPERKSGEGRYLSHSCFGNLEVNIVYTKGLDPANIRIMMTAAMPIYPQQELTFCYSCAYAVDHLSKTCLCKQLCCIQNIDLFPFITYEDIDKYVENLYAGLYNNFMQNTQGTWATRPDAPGTSAQGAAQEEEDVNHETDHEENNDDAPNRGTKRTNSGRIIKKPDRHMKQSNSRP